MAQRTNTLQKGSVRYIVFREKDTWYAAGLEFNIVESGDSPEEALLLLFEALAGYVESARKLRMRPHILNQKPDPEYEKMWKTLQDGKKVRSKDVYTFGRHSVQRSVTATV